jgi:hypothetical protein
VDYSLERLHVYKYIYSGTLDFKVGGKGEEKREELRREEGGEKWRSGGVEEWRSGGVAGWSGETRE